MEKRQCEVDSLQAVFASQATLAGGCRLGACRAWSALGHTLGCFAAFTPFCLLFHPKKKHMWVNVCSYHINSIVSAFVDAEHLRWRVLIVLGSFKARIMRDDQSVTAGKIFPVNL